MSQQPEDILTESIDQYKPVKIFALFSGGHDSLSITHWASQQPGFSGVFHVNTRIGIEESNEFVRNTCRKYGWPLFEATPPELQYEDIVLRFGFPGPAAHRYTYVWLKERALNAFIQTQKVKRSDKILLITGVRRQESIRRMGTTQEVSKSGAKIWVAPFIDKSKVEVNDYLNNHNLPRNEVVDLIHKSGECLCGAYARQGELDELAVWFPKKAHYLRQLENRVKSAGFPWGWEDEPPAWFQQWQKGQMFMPGMQSLFMPMCHDCLKV